MAVAVVTGRNEAWYGGDWYGGDWYGGQHRPEDRPEEQKKAQN
ncbi:hypothetical protein [Daejeonella sp.]